ncbi:MAG: glycoside hydrolase [Spirochaetaceae bacterium]|jgi:alpha-D-xyloside xylohydrolase|nr:glycoside hydrolase [Spirochaetaceae bacterium]
MTECIINERERIVFDPERFGEKEFSFPGGTARLSIKQEAEGPLLAIRLPYRGAYGMGEKYDALNQKGRRVVNQVEEHFCRQGDKTYCPMPFFFTDSGFGFYADTLRLTVFDFGEEICVTLPSGTPFFLFAGSPARIIGAYMSCLGKPVLPPKWVLGPWISANRWRTQAQVEAQIGLLEKHGFPATVLVIEAWSDEATFYIFNGAEYRAVGGGETLAYDDFDFSRSAFWQNPREMIQKLHDAGLRLVLWQIPAYRKQGDDEPVCVQHDHDRAYALENRLCVMDTQGKPYTIPPGHWFADSLLPDFSNPETRRLWFAKRRYLLDIGVDGFKTDGGEFVYREDLIFHDGKTGAEMKNGYAQRYVAAYRDALPEDKVLFSRAGFSGQHTTPLLWAGDQESSFDELRSQLRAGLSAALSGIIFWGFDIAGFAGPLPSSELYLRATQLACFSPIMQWHSEPEGGQFRDIQAQAAGNNERSPWNIAAFDRSDNPDSTDSTDTDTLLDKIRFWHRLRMNLLPYLYNEALHCVHHSVPLMRPLIYDGRPLIYDGWNGEPVGEHIRNADDQFMLGRSLLVAPVLSPGQDSRRVWLPPGEWYGLFDHRRYQGGRYSEAVSINTIPVFVKGGSGLALNLPATADTDGGLGFSVGNGVTGYQNLRFMLYGNAGQTHFEDDLGNNFTLHWEGAAVTLSGTAVSAYTTTCRGGPWA